MPAIAPLNKINEVLAALVKNSNSFTATIGSIPNSTLWGQIASTILNGNAILIVPGPAVNQVTFRASAMVMVVPSPGFVKLKFATDTPVSSVVSAPPGARTDGTNYFFSQFNRWYETPVLLAGYYSHMYVVYDTTLTDFTGIAVIATPTPTEPSQSLWNQIGNTSGQYVSARQAMCCVNALGQVTVLQTFPAVYNSLASVVADAAPSFCDWKEGPTAVGTNAVQVQFTFPAGTGTGQIGEVAVNLDNQIVAFMAVSPQLAKDADVPMILKWNLMLGQPGAFLV